VFCHVDKYHLPAMKVDYIVNVRIISSCWCRAKALCLV